MNISVRTRFEVLKRDRFACAYCGKHPPDVLLEVDHIVPRAAGGSDELDNLICACWDCNRGKADRLREEGTRPVVSREILEDAEERIAQAEAYALLMSSERKLLNRMTTEVTGAWARAFAADLVETDEGTSWRLQLDYERFPDEASIRTFLKRLPASEVLDAVDATASRFNTSTNGACRYFYAICWRRIKNPTG